MTHHPLVSPWMLNEGSGVRATAERLRELARLLGGVEVTVGSTLGSAVTALGWQGQVTDRADEASLTARTMLTRLADCCEAAGTALLELAGAMSWHGPRLTELLADGGSTTPRFGSPGGPTPISGAEPRDPVIGLPVEPGVGGSSTMTRATLPVDDQERLIRQHVEDLEVLDQRCHDRLTHLRDDLEGMFPHGITPEFLRSLVPSQVWRQLVASGVVRHILPIRGDRGSVVRPREIGPIRHTLPIRRELLPGCVRVVRPPVHRILPIHEERTLPIREESAHLTGAEVDPGPVTTAQPLDR